jgi:putative intracellular protease/amidase
MRYKLIIAITIILIFIIGCSTTNTNNTTNDTSDPVEYNTNIWWEEVPEGTSFDLSGKSILILIADGFNFQEVNLIKGYWEEWGALVTIAGNEKEVLGRYFEGTDPFNIDLKLTEHLTVDILINDVIVSDYDALFFPGGFSPANLLNDDNIDIIELVKEAYEQNLYLSGLCHGPLVLAKADIIRGKQITGEYIDVKPVVDASGGIYVYSPVVVDGLFITANWAYFGPLAINVAKCLIKGD